MTPCTWSLVQIFMTHAMPLSAVDGHPLFGNIDGRLYMNLSLLASVSALLGFGRQRFAALNEPFFGRIPDGVEMPMIPFSRWRIVPTMVATRIRVEMRTRRRRARARGPPPEAQPRLPLAFGSMPSARIRSALAGPGTVPAGCLYQPFGSALSGSSRTFRIVNIPPMSM